MKGTVLDDRALVMTDGDTVATALEDLSAGERIGADSPVTLAEDVPFGHKVALVDHDPGDPVTKYGEVIGEATTTIDGGEWVHTHNCESRRGRGDRHRTGVER
jgi:altronate dehydratase small subunit